MQVEDNSHEETETLMTIATHCCLEVGVVFFDLDIDILVPVVSHYDELCKHTATYMMPGCLIVYFVVSG